MRKLFFIHDFSRDPLALFAAFSEGAPVPAQTASTTRLSAPDPRILCFWHLSMHLMHTAAQEKAAFFTRCGAIPHPRINLRHTFLSKKGAP